MVQIICNIIAYCFTLLSELLLIVSFLHCLPSISSHSPVRVYKPPCGAETFTMNLVKGKSSNMTAIEIRVSLLPRKYSILYVSMRLVYTNCFMFRIPLLICSFNLASILVTGDWEVLTER